MIQKETYSLENIEAFNIAATAIDLMKQNTSLKNIMKTKDSSN